MAASGFLVYTHDWTDMAEALNLPMGDINNLLDMAEKGDEQALNALMDIAKSIKETFSPDD